MSANDYWQARYIAGGNSGSGSYGRLAQFKAEIINNFIKKYNLSNIMELGSGDGAQLKLFEVEKYTGFDVAPAAVEKCRELYYNDNSKKFEVYYPLEIENNDLGSYELTLSLDVLYHIMETKLWQSYIRALFAASSRFVIIYAVNNDLVTADMVHQRYRKFTDWIEENISGWSLAGYMPNRYPYDKSNPNETSLANFYFFSRDDEFLDDYYAVYRPAKNNETPSFDTVSKILIDAKSDFTENKIDDAILKLERAAALDINNHKVLNNLAMIYKQIGDIHKAEQLLKRILADDSNSALAKSNLGLLYLYENRTTEVIPFLNELALLENNIQGLSDKLLEVSKQIEGFEFSTNNKVVQTRHKRMAILCLPNFDSFLRPVATALEDKLKIALCVNHDINNILKTILYSDLIWIEWANELANILTNQHAHSLSGKRVFCRIHSYEVLYGLTNNINFNCITDIVFVSHAVKKIFLQKHPGVAQFCRLHVIPNAIDLEKFPLINKSSEKNIAFLSTVDDKKNPMLLMEAFYRLHNYDSALKLIVGGAVRDLGCDLAMKQFMKINDLRGTITFDGHINNVPLWLTDKNYIMCTSKFESHGVGLCEAIATGCVPLINYFFGADEIYPRDFLWKNFDELENMVSKSPTRTAQEYRQFILNNYSISLLKQRLEEAIFDKQVVVANLIDN